MTIYFKYDTGEEIIKTRAGSIEEAEFNIHLLLDYYDEQDIKAEILVCK